MGTDTRPEGPLLMWVRTKHEMPATGHIVLLHTPQWSQTAGDFTVGYWDGEKWEADDGRDFAGNPPVHWASVRWPEFEGDEDEWSDDGDWS